jgi:hypothetical protein
MFDRGRRAGSLRRQQSTETTDLIWITMPDALFHSFAANTLMSAISQYGLVAYILERLSNGTIDKIRSVEKPENGIALDVKVDGKWYHLTMSYDSKGDYHV